MHIIAHMYKILLTLTHGGKFLFYRKFLSILYFMTALHYSLAIAPPVYTMWCFTGGELAVLMLIENMATPLNGRDKSIVFGLFVCIISGAFAVRTRLFAFLMAVSWISFGVCMYGILITVRERTEETLIASTKRANIIRYSFLVFSFGAITLFVNAGIMNNDQLLVCLAAMDAFTKGILTILNLDSQLVRLLSLEGQLLVELEANTRRREFMKYVSTAYRCYIEACRNLFFYTTVLRFYFSHAYCTFSRCSTRCATPSTQSLWA